MGAESTRECVELQVNGEQDPAALANVKKQEIAKYKSRGGVRGLAETSRRDRTRRSLGRRVLRVRLLRGCETRWTACGSMPERRRSKLGKGWETLFRSYMSQRNFLNSFKQFHSQRALTLSLPLCPRCHPAWGQVAECHPGSALGHVEVGKTVWQV